MQSAIKSTDPNAPVKKTVWNTFQYIYKTNGIKGLYRGVSPRIGLGELWPSLLIRQANGRAGAWQTICMVSLADYVRAA